MSRALRNDRGGAAGRTRGDRRARRGDLQASCSTPRKARDRLGSGSGRPRLNEGCRGTRAATAISPSLVLHPRPPFRLDLTVWALRRRALNEVDAWDGSTYRRVLVLDGEPAEIAMTQEGGAEAPALHVRLNGAGARPSARLEARAALERMLSLELDIDPFHSLAAGDPILARSALSWLPPAPPSERVRVPRERGRAAAALARRGTLTPQSAVTHLRSVLCGTGKLVYAFPEPAELAAARPGSIRALGFSLRKATTIVAIADAANEGRLDLESLGTRDDEHVVETPDADRRDWALER